MTTTALAMIGTRSIALFFLKALFFYPMLWVRGILKLGLRVIGAAAILAMIGSLFIDELALNLTIILGLIGFGTFLIGQFYDQLLLKLNPTDNVLILS